jgi:anti-anti-sigma factor
MEPFDEGLALAVEHPVPGTVVVRVAGELTRTTGPRLARLLDVLAAPPGRVRHLVVDLGDVRSFGVGGLDVLRRAAHGCGRLGVDTHVCGVAARVELLPMAVVERLAVFRTFPTVEQAVAALAGEPALPRA